MTDRAEYYEQSGIFPLYSVPLMLLAGIIIAAITAPLAGLVTLTLGMCGLIFFIPFGIVAIVHSVICMIAVAATANGCHVRNSFVVKVCCLLVNVVAAYLFLHSVGWIFFGAGWGLFFPLLNPQFMYEAVMQFVAGAADPNVAAGCVIALIVLTIVIYLFIAMTAAGLEVDPYCETCGQWAEEQKPDLAIEPKDALRLREEFEEGDFSALLSPKRKSYERHFAKLNFYECKSCEDSSYLRVTAHTKTPKKDKPGEYDEESETVVDLIKIPHGLHAALIQRMEEGRQAETESVSDEYQEFD